MRTLTFNRVLGAGAMGTVYHAELRVPSGGFLRQCAVKVMKTSSPDADHFRQRMRDEARLLGMLQDEQILGVSELVTVQGRDAVVMEFVEGVDLADVIKGTRVPPRALAELGAELAGTLARAHSAKHPTSGVPLRVVHRDVKPANVMVTSRGGVRLLDFGVARAAFDSRESQTQGLVLGTLNYFPPEILAGGEPSPAVDIFGLGLSLWECAAGKEWGSPQVHQNRFERRVEQRMEEIAAEYKAIVPVLRQVLQWDPAKRPDGKAVEKLLLAAADSSQGEGLRTWARNVIAPILAERDKKAKKDELVGKTIPIDDPVVEGADGLQPIKAPSQDAALQEQTFNDLAPPAAVKRAREEALRQAPPPAVQLREAPQKVAAPTPKKAARRGPSPVLVLGGAGFLGLLLGSLLLVFIVLVIILIKIS